MRRVLLVALILLLAGAAQARAKKKIPTWRSDYAKLSEQAKDLARQGRYGQARRNLQKYLEKHGQNLERKGSTRNDIQARGYVESARAGAERYRALQTLWSNAKRSPAAECRALVEALIGTEALDFSATREELLRALGLLREHDDRTKALVAGAFPMRIEIEWTDGGANQEYEQRLLDRLVVASSKAGLPVVSKDGTWKIEQSLRFSSSKQKAAGDDAYGLGASGLSVHRLLGNCRILDDKGELRAEWLSKSAGRTFGGKAIRAKYRAAEKLAEQLLDRLILFVLKGGG